VNFKKFPVGFAHINKNAIDKILSFSIYQFLFNLVYIGYRNIDKFFIGKFFGMADLGYYEKSYRLMMLPLENVSSVISPVLHPLLSELQNDKDKIWSSYLKMLRMLSEFSFILSVALYFLSDSIILFLYGENWKFAIPLFKILSLSVCFQLLQAPIGAVLQSINKVKALFYGGLWMLLFVTLALFVSWYFNSIVGLVFGIDIAFFAGFIVYQIYLAHFFGKSIVNIIVVIISHLLYAAIFFAICFAIKRVVQPQSIITSALVYSLLTIVVFFCLKTMGKLPESSILVQDIINKIRGRK
jgi:PST family polysaccharide transporter